MSMVNDLFSLLKFCIFLYDPAIFSPHDKMDHENLLHDFYSCSMQQEWHASDKNF